MPSFGTAIGAGLEQIAGQNQPAQPPQGQPAPQAEPPQQGGGLPPTGLQSQMQSLNQYYDEVRNAKMTDMRGQEANIGFDPYQFQFEQGQQQLGSVPNQAQGSSNLDTLAKSLAQSYGLSIGRGSLVDENGNFLVTAEQLAQASGGQETMGSAAAKLNMIAQAVAKQQVDEKQKLGTDALQMGLGQVRSNARGSLASMQSGLYQAMQQNYMNQSMDVEATDFSYWIYKEQEDIAAELQRRAEKRQKKAARTAVAGGAIMVVGGALSGNVGLVAAGAGQATTASGQTGWF